jgi:uncharacterized protein with FMN-binding domain
MRSAKPLAALALTAAGSALIVGFQVPGTGAAPAASTDGSSATGTPTGDAAGVSTTTGQYADGTYLGAAVDEPWGVFQVQATVSGGQLVDVTIVTAPTDRHSSRINNSSIPTLTSQALASQSADVDVISGATWTSESYASSLQAALDAAA